MTYPFARRNIAGLMPPRLAQLVETTMIWGGTSTGSANAQIIAPEFTADLKGHPTYVFVAGYTNTGAATLSADGGTTNTALRKADGTAMAGGEIVAGTAYQVVFDGTYWRLIGGSGGGGPVNGVSSLNTANFTLGAAHKNKMVRCSGTSLTVAVTAAASLGADWSCIIINEGSTALTIDPNGSETINGSVTLSVPARMSAVLAGDGSALYAALGGTLLAPVGFDAVSAGSAGNLSNNNKTFADASGSACSAARMIYPANGKQYTEIRIDAVSGEAVVGFVDVLANLGPTPTGIDYPGFGTNTYGLGSGGTAYLAAATTSGFTTFGATDVMMLAYDSVNQKGWIGKNGTWIASGNPATGANPMVSTLTGAQYFAVGTRLNATTATFTIRPTAAEWSYTAPSGFSGY